MRNMRRVRLPDGPLSVGRVSVDVAIAHSGAMRTGTFTRFATTNGKPVVGRRRAINIWEPNAKGRRFRPRDCVIRRCKQSSRLRPFFQSQEVFHEGFGEGGRRGSESRKRNLVMSIGGIDEVVLFGAIAAKFNPLSPYVVDLGKLTSAAKVRQRKLGGVEIGRRMRP